MPHDDELNSLSYSSLTWMATMIRKDEEEKFEKDLSLIEYLASFTNPEAVQEIRRSRELDVKSGDTDALKKVLEAISGREAPEFKGNG